MGEDNFILRIILEAIDNASGPINRLNEEVSRLKRQSGTAGEEHPTRDLQRGLEDTAASARSAESSVRSHRQETERAASSTRAHSAAVSEGTRALDDYKRATSGAADEQQNLRQKGQELLESVSKLNAEMRASRTMTEQQRADAQRLSQDLQGLSRSYKATSEEARLYSIEAGRLRDVLRSDQQRVREDVALQGQHVDALNRVAREQQRALADQAKAADAARTSSRAIDDLVTRYENFHKSIAAGDVTRKDAVRGLLDFGRELRSLSRSFESGSEDALKYGRMADQAIKQAKSSIPDAESAVAKLANRFDDWGIKIVSLSAQLRGLGLALVVGLAQQFDTVLIGLAGALVAVGSAAATAAAGIGGALVSAMAQAIPVAGVLFAAVDRIKDVFTAAQQAAKLQQQAFVDSAQNANQQANAADAVVSAQDALKNSYTQLADAEHRVADAQLAVVDARRQAQRQIVDLVLAEREAQLAAAGASLSLQQAQQELQSTVLQGGTGTQLALAQLQVQQAQLGLQRANIQVPRTSEDAALAQRRGVSGAPSVLAAEQGLMSARQGVSTARTTITRDQSALERAQRQQAQVAQGPANTARQQLDYMLAQMDATERRLYTVVRNLMGLFAGPHTPLSRATDAIIKPFTDGLQTVYNILSNPRNPLTIALNNLGVSAGGAIDKLVREVFSRKDLNFFKNMADEAARNLPVIIDSIGHILSILRDIATAAAPVVRFLVDGFNKWITNLDSATSSQSGMQRLHDFFVSTIPYIRSFVDLAASLAKLFLAVINDAAPTGKSIIDQLTNSINQATQWVQQHGPEVRQFFQQSADVLRTIGGLILQLGRAMISLFDPETVRTFANFLTNYLLPALADALRLLGFVVNAIMEFFNLFGPTGGKILEIGIAAFAAMNLFAKAFDPVIRAISRVRRGWHALLDLIGRVRGITPSGPGGEAGGAGATIEESMAAGGRTAAETIGSTMEAAGAKVADSIGAAMAAGGTEAGAEINAAEVAGGAEAGAEIAGTAATATAVAAGGAGAAGVTAAEAAGGGGIAGAAATIFSRAIPILGAAALADHFNIFGQNTAPGRSSQSDLASVLGPVGGTHRRGIFDPAGILNTATAGLLGSSTSPDQSGGTTRALKGLQDGLKGIQNPAELSTRSLTQLYRQVIQLQGAPDLSAKQVQGLGRLAGILNPVNREIAQVEATWQATFSGINATTGNVLKQVQQVVQNDIQNISDNLGNGTRPGAEALSATITGAYQTITGNTNLAAKGVQQGLKAINTMLNNALKSMGAPHLTQNLMNDLGPLSTMQWLQFAATGAANTAVPGIGHRAMGGYEQPQAGGKLIQVVEGGYPEVVLTTDPKHARRQRALLSRYLRDAPHVLQGYRAGGLVQPTGEVVLDPGVDMSVGQEPAIYEDLRHLAADLHQVVYVISGYRSPQHSVAVGGFADDPHTRGEAADIGIGSASRASMFSISESLLRAVGLYRPFYPASAAEVNHVQLLATAAGGAPVAGVVGPGGAQMMLTPLTAPRFPMSGILGGIGQGAMDTATQAANQYLQRAGGIAASVDAAGTPAQARAWTERAMKIAGVSGALWEKMLLRQEGRESSYNPNAVNRTDINAQRGDPSEGILQTTISTFKRFMMGGYTNILEPVSNIIAAIRYMIATYGHGDPGLAAQVMWARGGGAYGAGGFIEAADGFHGFVNRPTMLLTGEKGIEHVSVTPMQAGGFTSDIHKGLYRPGLLETLQPAPDFDGITSAFSFISSGLAAIMRDFKQKNFVSKLTHFVDSITQQGGLLDQLSDTIDQATAAVTSRLTRASFVMRHGTVVQEQSPTQQAAAQAMGLEEERRRLTGESSTISRAQTDVIGRLSALLGIPRRVLRGMTPMALTRALSKAGLRGADQREATSLVAEFNNLYGRANDVRDKLDANLTDIYGAQSNVLQGRVNDVANTLGLAGTGIQSQITSAQTLGTFGILAPALTNQSVQNSRQQIDALRPILAAARRQGNQDLVSQITQQIQQLQSSITDLIAQSLDAQIQEVTDNAQRQMSHLQRTTRITGVIARGVERLPGGQLATAVASQMQTAVLQQTGDALRSQLSSYNNLLGQAVSTGNLGAQRDLLDKIDELNTQLAENTQAISDQTVATRQATIDFVNNTAQFQTGVFGGLFGAVQTMGQLTGGLDVKTALGLTQAQQGALTTQQGGLLAQLSDMTGGAVNLQGLSGTALINALASIPFSQIEAGMTASQAQQFEALVNSIISNVSAIEQNTVQLQQLNGQLTQPQSFSSSVWQLFRAAVFTGMGGLLPQFADLPGMGPSTPTGLPGGILNDQSAGMPRQRVAGDITTNLHITNPTSVFDPEFAGRRLAFHIKTVA